MAQDLRKEFDKFQEAVRKEAHDYLNELGQKAVSVAKATGTYQDHTGRLRRSTQYRVEGLTLTIENNTPYAPLVEARGKVVLSGAKAFVEDRLSRLK